MSIATFIGSSIGNGAAYAQHGATRMLVGTGRFGQDVVSSTTESYANKSSELAARRDAIRAKRQAPIAVTVSKRTTATRKVAA